MPATDEIVELDSDVTNSPYYNADMAPVPRSGRKWGTWDMAALWISMSACVPTYMLASSLIDGGMNWWQAVATVFLGNVVVLVPMILNAHAGTRYGIPFPVYCRASFGILGANVPALLRALVACGWFGIQCWIGGAAIYTIMAVWQPAWTELPKEYFGLNIAQLGCFFVFWMINVAVILMGIDSIRLLLNIKAPLLIALGLLLLWWAYSQANGFGPMLSQQSAFEPGGKKEGEFWKFFFPALTANVGFWATLSLNIPDFSRYARSQRDQAIGQALGLPATMGLFSFIGVAVTSATITIYGEAIWDPVVLLTKFQNTTVLALAMISLCLATLATNIAANVVSPANDFAHVAPKLVGFRMGGLITAIIGVLIQPWKLVSDPTGYIFTWLIGYSSLLGAVGGILIADYFLIRKTKLNQTGLYQKSGPYWYVGGVNPIAIIALAAGIAVCVPGFVATIKLAESSHICSTVLAAVGLADVSKFWIDLYSYAWFISFGVAFIVYLVGMTLTNASAKRR